MHASKSILFVDGLDELSTDHMKKTCAEIRELANQHPDLRIIAACRSNAYKGELSTFRELTILPFNSEQIRKFVRAWFGIEEVSIAMNLLAFIDQTPRVRELSSQPLMLCLICNAFKRYSSLTSRVTTLYEECLDSLFWEWDADRGITRKSNFEGIDRSKKKWFHSYLAYHMHLSRQRYIDNKSIAQLIKSYLPKLGIDRDEYAAILHSITADHGIFEKIYENLYGFRHLGIQEYLAAFWIAQDSRWKKLLTLSTLTDPWWEQVVGMSVGLLSDATECVQEILDINTITELDKYQVICSALRYDPILNENVKERILSSVLRVYHNGNKIERERAYSMLVGINDHRSSEVITRSLASIQPL